MNTERVAMDVDLERALGMVADCILKFEPSRQREQAIIRFEEGQMWLAQCDYPSVSDDGTVQPTLQEQEAPGS